MNYEKGFVPHAGDVTAICVGEQEFLGRVIDPDLEMVKAPVVLMYQFDADASQVDLGDDRSCLQASRRLGSYAVPPRSWRACGYAASGTGVAVVCS